MRISDWSSDVCSSDLLQVSYGEINEPEELHLGEDEHRTTASAHYNNGRGFSAMAAYSAKDRVPGPTLTAWLAEANWDLTKHPTIFGRSEERPCRERGCQYV